MKKNVCLVGYADMGKIHALNVYNHPKLNLKYIVGTNKTNLDQFIQENFTDSTIGILSKDLKIEELDFDILLISSATSTHYDYIMKGISSKKHIFW